MHLESLDEEVTVFLGVEFISGVGTVEVSGFYLFDGFVKRVVGSESGCSFSVNYFQGVFLDRCFRYENVTIVVIEHLGGERVGSFEIQRIIFGNGFLEIVLLEGFLYFLGYVFWNEVCIFKTAYEVLLGREYLDASGLADERFALRPCVKEVTGFHGVICIGI